MAAPIRTILFATYVSPFPTNSGERIRAVNLIKAFVSLGYDIEAIVGNEDGIDLKARDQPGVRFHTMPILQPRLRQAVDVYFRPHPEFVRQVTSLHQERPLTAIFLDYGFLGAQISGLRALGVPLILGTHNIESSITGQAPWPSLPRGLGLFVRGAVEAWHERRFFRNADAVICVSEEDRRAYEKFIPSDRVHIVPNFADIPDFYRDVERKPRIIMSGSFDNFQNMDGLDWFLNEVWDDTLRAATQFCIAGKKSDVAAREFPGVTGIVGIGARDDLLAEIAGSRCAIVPLRQGGGTRFKCLEAMAVRTPVISTTKGCEGILHEGTIRVADTPQALRSAILELLADHKQAQEQAACARNVYDRLYGLAANATRLERVIESAAKVHSSR